MWRSTTEFSDSKNLCKVFIYKHDEPVRYADVIQGWKSSAKFRQFYRSLIVDAPFDAVFWESPAITDATVDRYYEFVLVNSPTLINVLPEPSAFKNHFRSNTADETIVTFDNLGKDAFLVVPCPIVADTAYTHLAKFLRQAPDHQCHEFFRTLGEAIDKRLSHKPLWVSTSGLGIYWLHVRLDSFPKYYTHSPYKRFEVV